MAPITIASPTTEVSTWRREAPSARSSADSRLRWATRIENVLWMLNVATTSAMHGERQQDRLEHAEEVALDLGHLLVGQLGAGERLGVRRERGGDRRRAASSWLTPSSAATRIADTSPGRPTSSAAAASVNAA